MLVLNMQTSPERLQIINKFVQNMDFMFPCGGCYHVIYVIYQKQSGI